MNQDIEVALRYHNGTKHPNGNLMQRPHGYDPAFRPNPYKEYIGLQTIDLHLDKSPKTVSALKAISLSIPPDEVEKIPDLKTLARILYFSGGITKTINFPRIGEVEFRAASCTGALYHIEIYLVCGDIPGLEAGVYHFDPKNMRLDILRKGDYRSVLVNASSGAKQLIDAPAVLIFTDVFTRNSVKYQTREYRHAFWDCGTILANILSISSAHKLPSTVVMGYVDDLVNSLLDLNTEKEVSLALVPIGFTKKPPGEQITEIPKLDLKTEPLSSYEYDDPEIQKIHEASSLTSKNEVSEWLDVKTETKPLQPNQEQISLNYLKEQSIPQTSIEKVIIRRGSTREFSRESISFEQLSTILHYSTRALPADFLKPFGSSLIDLYMIINAVDGVKPGSYFYHREQDTLELLKEGMHRRTAGYLGLDQDLPADGSAAVFFMTDLQNVLKKLGNRGYRAAQLEASILGGRFYLSSYALNLGATGLTFYDDEVTKFFSPHAKDKSVMFMVVLGKKRKGLFN